MVTGLALLGVAVVSSVLFARGAMERSSYTNAAMCLDRPAGDCWVEVQATVVGKRVTERWILVDDHDLEIDKVGGPEVTLVGGKGLWNAVRPGELVTLRYWHGEVVRVSAEGHSADTADSPRVGMQRHYATGLVSLGLGCLLIITALGRLGIGRVVPAWSVRHRAVLRWAGRFALATAAVGVIGLGIEVYTRAAPPMVMTLVGTVVLVCAAGLLRLVRVWVVREPSDGVQLRSIFAAKPRRRLDREPQISVKGKQKRLKEWLARSH